MYYLIDVYLLNEKASSINKLQVGPKNLAVIV